MITEVQLSNEKWMANALYYEYSKAADPIGSGIISPVPVKQFGPELYNSGETRIVTLDNSKELRTNSCNRSILTCGVYTHQGRRFDQYKSKCNK